MGVALCLLSAACFGAMPIFGKLAYGAGVSQPTLLVLRFTLAAASLGLVLLLRPSSRAAVPAGPRWRLVLTALGLGAIGYATQASLYFAALDRLDAPMVSLVLYTYPVLVTVGAVALGRDRLTPRRAAALGISTCGSVLVLLGGGGVRLDLLGVLLAFGSAVTYTVYILVSAGAVHRMPPVVLSAWVMTGAAAALAVRAAVTGGVDLGFRPAGWLWIGCIVVVSTVLSMLAFFAGLRSAGPSTAAILSVFEPVVTTGLSALVLAEFLRPLQLLGGLVVLASIAVLQLGPRSAPPPAPSVPRPLVGVGPGR